jgi:hypothetical protein
MEIRLMGHSANIATTRVASLYGFKIGETHGVASRAKITPRRNEDDNIAINHELKRYSA